MTNPMRQIQPEAFSPDQRASLKQLIVRHGLHLKQDGKVMLSPDGDPIDWLFDLRAVFMEPEALDLAADLFWSAFRTLAPIQVAGMEVAAIPLVTAILLKGQQLGIPCNGLIARKERKTHGLGRVLEGTPNANPVVVVDDLINSGSALEKLVSVLRRENLKIEAFFTLIDFENPRGKQWRSQQGAALVSIFRAQEFEIPRPQIPSHFPMARQRYTPKWRFAAPNPNPFFVVPKSRPVYHQGKLIYGADAGTVHAVDAASGKELWNYTCTGVNAKGIFSSPAVYEDKVYIGAYNGNMYCLNANTGKEVWVNPCCEWIGSSPLVVPSTGLVYVGLEYAKPRAQGSIAAFDLHTGQIRWEQALQVVQHGSGAWCASNESVIFGTNDHTVMSLNGRNGAINWVYDLPRSVKYAPAVDANRNLCAFAGFDGGVYLVDALTGATKWRVETGNICYTTPLIIGDRVFVGSGDQAFYVIDVATGEILRKRRLGARIFSTPQFVPPSSVMFGTSSGFVYEIDIETLELTGWFAVPDGVTNGVLVLDGGHTIIVPTYQNELYAYEREIIKNQ